MKRLGFDNYLYEEGEPVLRSCWLCNPAHGHLKDVNFAHYCVWCDRTWLRGRFFDDFETVEAFDAWIVSMLGTDLKGKGEI